MKVEIASTLWYGHSEGGAADGAKSVGGVSAPVVVFSDEVVFDDGVVGMPHILDSVVLTCDPTDAQTAAFCSGVNSDVRFPWA
jgi:hypothetical protein